MENALGRVPSFFSGVEIRDTNFLFVGVVGGTLPYSSTAEDVNNKPNYTARCHYKQVNIGLKELTLSQIRIF